MVLTSDEIVAMKKDETESTSSDLQLPMEQEEAVDLDTSRTEVTFEDQPSVDKSVSISSEEINEEKPQDRTKTRSVSFAPTVEEIEIPSRYDPSYISPCPPIDFLDALVESYKLQSLTHLTPLTEEKKYVPKTRRSRLNPNWREHRIRRLMNKLEELSLWDREEELKVAQAQFLREQKLEQIQDRQRNHDLCLNLMRQRHESEMESAVLLDRANTCFNDENTTAIIAQTMNLASPMSLPAYGLSTPPYSLKRCARQDQEKIPIYKTPTGRYRQFEGNMNTKLEKIKSKLRPDWEIMHAYRAPIPPTVVPLFNETYASNGYTQYYYGIASHLHQRPPHASSPDYETRRKSHSNRDVRVPLKEERTDDNPGHYDDEDYNRSQSNPLSVHKTREYSFIRSPQPISNSIHQRSLNDDLNAITHFPMETGRSILRNVADSSNVLSSKSRSSSVPTNKRVMFAEQNDSDEENFYQADLLSLSSNQ